MLAEVGKSVDNEMATSPDTEELYANEYSKALQMLRDKVIKQKRFRILLKERTTAIPNPIVDIGQESGNTDTSTSRPLTFMEKLQQQANVKVNEVLNKNTDKFINGKRNTGKKRKPKRAKK